MAAPGTGIDGPTREKLRDIAAGMAIVRCHKPNGAVQMRGVIPADKHGDPRPRRRQIREGVQWDTPGNTSASRETALPNRRLSLLTLGRLNEAKALPSAPAWRPSWPPSSWGRRYRRGGRSRGDRGAQCGRPLRTAPPPARRIRDRAPPRPQFCDSRRVEHQVQVHEARPGRGS